jgi:hypothetical protein
VVVLQEVVLICHRNLLQVLGLYQNLNRIRLLLVLVQESQMLKACLMRRMMLVHSLVLVKLVLVYWLHLVPFLLGLYRYLLT